MIWQSNYFTWQSNNMVWLKIAISWWGNWMTLASNYIKRLSNYFTWLINHMIWHVNNSIELYDTVQQLQNKNQASIVNNFPDLWSSITHIIYEHLLWIFIELMQGKSLKTVLLTIIVFMARQVLRLKFNKVGNQNFMNINMTSRVNRPRFMELHMFRYHWEFRQHLHAAQAASIGKSWHYEMNLEQTWDQLTHHCFQIS